MRSGVVILAALTDLSQSLVLMVRRAFRRLTLQFTVWWWLRRGLLLAARRWSLSSSGGGS